MKKILNVFLISVLCFSAVSCCKMRSASSRIPGPRNVDPGVISPSDSTGGN